jgi:hypothetical protein
VSDKVVSLFSASDTGFQVCSVPVQKLKQLASDKHRHWSLEGDFLVLHSYRGNLVI